MSLVALWRGTYITGLNSALHKRPVMTTYVCLCEIHRTTAAFANVHRSTTSTPEQALQRQSQFLTWDGFTLTI
ncbi:hypothetical protein BBBOND_0103270 [Babesia bigemina]|uniref:Uncharacterized protein n=1 Tax=Babesia bigemina TaxID=5866 RepID=A0A061D012_BABBI|nr:hypothetical protein BBBOND_0103270 [Babesia bigemina]CDR94008.1 hypothetical protein BBBOND_0103270 [Babesia bigemina]|eukprot:XP_012766194.1 hypothetical protein BBBOND_0103270 [Babesia bigemina]